MRELAELLARLRELDRADAPALLVTVARVEGSSYRREGARMLVEPDGRLTGVLTGGCLERDLVAVAGATLAAGTPRLLDVDLTAEQEAYWGGGSGCSGRLRLLLEPLDAGGRAALVDRLATVLEQRREVRRATVLAAPGLAAGAPLATPAAERALAALAAGAARAAEIPHAGGRAEVLLESLLPPVHLLLIGAERDAPPLLRLARELGWAATVVMPRPDDDARRRVGALGRVQVTAPRALAAEVELSPRTAALVATHRYLDDLAYLAELAAAETGYLAVLGPERRRTRLVADLGRREPAAAALLGERLRGPAGLALGGRAPEEVALSVVAEIQATLTGASGRPLGAAAARADAAPPLAGRGVTEP